MSSKPSTLVLVRHGQSQWNLENKFTGWVDVPLTEKGEAEAARAGRQIAKLHLTFDRAYTSVLKRANETLAVILRELKQEKLPIERDQALNERHYGELQGLNKDEMRKKYGADQVHLWRRSFDVAPPGGESLKNTAERTLPYFEAKIMPDLKAGKNVLVAAHGNSLRSIVMQLDGLSGEEVAALELATGVPLVYTFDAGGRVLSKKTLTT
ncbi:MAG: 2,3-bisphosphoglycerate-dependent phosphoglycerate mutase [Candidatus Omnitrophica bacterium CG11_big_fil_rev_8_21_14_0_20_64_10]|nr:MAG: 2,3-bisphosphoglycerate-dependent phosphoglycerate mutase [Candidatus Omnitrophica bacterium CG11_big_fil_rev_8_21_14_0_20_64_10]